MHVAGKGSTTTKVLSVDLFGVGEKVGGIGSARSSVSGKNSGEGDRPLLEQTAANWSEKKGSAAGELGSTEGVSV